jgi:hypothetical protein
MFVNASLTPVGTRLSWETTQTFPRPDLSLTDRSVAASLAAAPTEAPTKEPVTTPTPAPGRTAVPSTTTPLPERMPAKKPQPREPGIDPCGTP